VVPAHASKRRRFATVMALYFQTNTPKKLLATYKRAIDEGHVATWSYDSEGDFTHTADQWNRKAWLRPKIIPQQQLVLHILAPKDLGVSSVVYAVYHGRIIESFLRHCDGLFVDCRSSSRPEGGDSV
jgi:hypothetical protein